MDPMTTAKDLREDIRKSSKAQMRLLDNLEGSIASLEEENDHLADENESLFQENTRLKRENENLKREKKNSKNREKNLKRQNQQFQQANEGWQQSYNSSMDQIGTLRAELRDLEQSHTECQVLIAEMQNENKYLEDKCDQVSYLVHAFDISIN